MRRSNYWEAIEGSNRSRLDDADYMHSLVCTADRGDLIQGKGIVCIAHACVCVRVCVNIYRFHIFVGVASARYPLPLEGCIVSHGVCFFRGSGTVIARPRVC